MHPIRDLQGKSCILICFLSSDDLTKWILHIVIVCNLSSLFNVWFGVSNDIFGVVEWSSMIIMLTS